LAAGFAWIGLVAVMAQAGFSGEPRYALPGAALVSIAGAAGLVTLVRDPARLVTLVREAGPPNFGLLRGWVRLPRRVQGTETEGVCQVSSLLGNKLDTPPAGHAQGGRRSPAPTDSAAPLRTHPLNARRSPAPADGWSAASPSGPPFNARRSPDPPGRSSSASFNARRSPIPASRLWSGIPAATRPVAAALAAAALLIAAAPRLADLPDLRRSQAWQRGLASDLERAITAAGGRDAVLACGRPYVGNLRGPLLAYHLHVEKRRVAFEPEPPGTVFRSRLNAGDPVEPLAPRAFTQRAQAGRWQVLAAC
jgi:hypothetical protein